ncbi:MAG: hypothetical protein N2645_05175 [Clostridia bacterium]|nr:hypothetical protein [Clostridia bacterium]
MERKRICIMIKDNGMGISKENLAHIIEPFFLPKAAGIIPVWALATVIM